MRKYLPARLTVVQGRESATRVGGAFALGLCPLEVVHLEDFEKLARVREDGGGRELWRRGVGNRVRVRCVGQSGWVLMGAWLDTGGRPDRE